MAKGQRRIFNFHGCYSKKEDAVRRERATPGAFIKEFKVRGKCRYSVVSRRKP